MKKIPMFSLDYYNKKVIQQIMNKYNYSEMDASRQFIMSEVHRMLEDEAYAMWEFSANAIFDMWEVEKVTGMPQNSIYLRSE